MKSQGSHIFNLKLWTRAVRSPIYLGTVAGIIISSMFLCQFLAAFLLYKESVEGIIIWDPITSYFDPINFNPFIFYLTIFSIFLGYVFTLQSPKLFLYALISFALINLLRMSMLYLVDLDPPADIILLYDPLLEHTFYDGAVITKDLFFSGHTSNIVMFAFILSGKKKFIFYFLGLAVGSMLVLQHVHYTIDVLAAPIFAYLVYRISKYLIQFIFPEKA